MAQSDLTIQNQSFPSFRSDLNDALTAINTTQSGTSRPSSAVAGTIWLDTTNATNPTLKLYDGADDISLATLDYSANTVNWLDSTVSFDIVNDLSPQLGGMLDVNGQAIGNGTEELIKFSETASAVNEVTVTNSATGNAPEISATGDDTNIDFKLTPKGTGKLVLDGLNFPTTDGTAGQVLQTDGSANLSFADASGGLSGWSEDGANNNLLPASSSAGIYLGVTTATASNLLDDYEEGTYIPVVIDSGESATLTISSTYKYLSYTKVGRLVHVGGLVIVDSVSGSWSGGLQISLPFTSASLDGYAGTSVLSVVTYDVDFTTGTSPTFLVGQGQAYAVLRTSGDSIVYGFGRPANGGQVYVSGTYFSA